MSDAVKLTCLECAQVNRVPAERISEKPKCGTCGASMMPTKAVEITPDVLRKASRNDDIPLIVDFWAPWCGPCRTMAPEFSKAASALSGSARFVKVNTEDYPQVAGQNRIRGIPTMIRFTKGREVARQSGAMKADRIIGWVTQAA